MYFWPGMFYEIKPMISQCRPCSVNCPSQPKNPRVSNQPLDYLGPPIGHVGLDLFEFGDKHHLVFVDQCSGFPMFTRLNSLTSSAVIGHLKSWFSLLGWPLSYPQEKDVYASGSVDQVMFIVVGAPFI